MQEKNVGGRPPKPIDWALFEELCEIQCTQKEIAGVFKMDADTVREKVAAHYGECYTAVYQKLSEGGKASLRRTQTKLSKKHASMAIFLGKQYLGQKDNDQVFALSSEASEQFNALMNQIKAQQGPSCPHPTPQTTIDSSP